MKYLKTYDKIFESSDIYKELINYIKRSDIKFILDLDQLIDINEKDKFGYTLLIYACIDYNFVGKKIPINIEYVKELLKRKANANIQDNDGKTALIWASEKLKYNSDILKIIDMLISVTDYSIKDKYNKDFLDYLKKSVREILYKKYPYLKTFKDGEKYNL
jgi:ankyrin repeat protein